MTIYIRPVVIEDATAMCDLIIPIIAAGNTIRADHASGLGYYSSLGFRDYSVLKPVPLSDETRVDRISKRYGATEQV